MNAELLYTSAPSGLKQGSRGFCTVLSTAGMPINLASKLESLSGYRHVYPSGTPDANKNPVGFSHLRFSLGGRMVSVISRISDYGLDYSQRTNKLVHHIVVDAPMPPSGPAALLRLPGLMRDAWDGRCATVPPPTLPIMEVPPRVCSEWESMTGDAGWGGVVANTWLRPQPKPLFIVFSEDQAPRLLSLIAESIALLPVRQRWQATFGTYVTNLPPDVDCKVRCVIAGSEEARMASARGTVINLTATIGPAVDTNATRAAREGLSIGGGGTIRAPISVADAETSESDPSPSAVPPAYEEFEFDVDKPFGEVARQAPPDVRYTGTRFKTPSKATATTGTPVLPNRKFLAAAICLLLAFLGLAGYGIYRNTPRVSQVVKETKKEPEAPVNDSQNNDNSGKDRPPKDSPIPVPPPPPVPVTAADFKLSLEVPSLPSTDASVIEVQISAEALKAVAKIEPLKLLPAEWKQWEAKWKWQRKEPNLFWKDLDGESTDQLSITDKEPITTEFKVIAIVSNSPSGQSLPPIESKIIRVAKVAPPPPPAYKPEDFDLDIRFILKGNQDGKPDIPLQTGVRGAIAEGVIKPKNGVDAEEYQATYKWILKSSPTEEKPIPNASDATLLVTRDLPSNSAMRCEATIKFDSGVEIVVKSRGPPLQIADVLAATIDLQDVLKSPSIPDLSFPIEIPDSLQAIAKGNNRGDGISAFGLKLQKDPKFAASVVKPVFRNLKSSADNVESKKLVELEIKLTDYQKNHKEIRKKIDALKAVCQNKGKDIEWAMNILGEINANDGADFTTFKGALIPLVRKAQDAIDGYNGKFLMNAPSQEDLSSFKDIAIKNGWLYPVPPNGGGREFNYFMNSLKEFKSFWEEDAGSLKDLGRTPKKLFDSLLKEIEDFENDQRKLLLESVSIETKADAFAIYAKSKSTGEDEDSLAVKDKKLGDFGMCIMLKFINEEQNETQREKEGGMQDPKIPKASSADMFPSVGDSNR
ncbi:MAG: hypothetical protein KGQ60_05210 [Planctomycetes bacterium]|nr:hypothetical protein [Planctomycetota bacterium]